MEFKIINSAIFIQKIWKGFLVRKYLKEYLNVAIILMFFKKI